MSTTIYNHLVDTTLTVTRSNLNMNHPGGQHTNGPPDMWFKFDSDDYWYCVPYNKHCITMATLSSLINMCTSKEEVIYLMELQ